MWGRQDAGGGYLPQGATQGVPACGPGGLPLLPGSWTRLPVQVGSGPGLRDGLGERWPRVWLRAWPLRDEPEALTGPLDGWGERWPQVWLRAWPRPPGGLGERMVQLGELERTERRAWLPGAGAEEQGPQQQVSPEQGWPLPVWPLRVSQALPVRQERPS